MKFIRHDLFFMEICYSVKSIDIDGTPHVLFAPNGKGPAVLTRLTGEQVCHIWEDEGGVMSMVPLPGENGNFLAVQQFYPGFNAAFSKIVYCRHRDETHWTVEKFLDVPYLHRFDILQNGGRRYLVTGVLCRSKQSRDDWSSPGFIAFTELDKDNRPLTGLQILQDGLTKNHGYGKVVQNGVEKGLFTSEEGIFLATPPAGESAGWSIAHIFDRPTSEARLFDIDGDGLDELVTIEPFHGSHFRIYKPTDAGFRLVYECDIPMEFYHVIWTGLLRGRPVIIGAGRRGAQKLFLVEWQADSGFRIVTIDEPVGISNVDIVLGETYDTIAAANTESGLATFYHVYD